MAEPKSQREEQDIEEIELSEEAATLLTDLKSELDEAIAARQRALADFANYQRRAADNEIRARQDGAADVVRALLAVLDNFDLALAQPAEDITVDQLLGGVKIVHDELVTALTARGLTRIEPKPGDELDPVRHQAMLRQAADGVPDNHIVCVLQAGYMLGDVVLRPAKVAVAGQAE